MTDPSQAGGQVLDQASTLLSETRSLIDRVLVDLKSKTLEGERVSPAKLDNYQLVSYEISLCWAECTSARFLLDYARRLQSEAPGAAGFASRLAALFCAEAVTTTTGRLRARPVDFGLSGVS